MAKFVKPLPLATLASYMSSIPLLAASLSIQLPALASTKAVEDVSSVWCLVSHVEHLDEAYGS